MWFRKKKEPITVQASSDDIAKAYERKVMELTREIESLKNHLSIRGEFMIAKEAELRKYNEVVKETTYNLSNAIKTAETMPTAAEKYGTLSSYLYTSIKVLEMLHKKL